MKKSIVLFLPLAAILVFSGCMTQRSAQFPGRSYDAVFSGAVKGLCQDESLIVYRADKATGEIRFQGRGLMIGAPDTMLLVSNVAGTPQMSITLPGPNNPYAEQVIRQASSHIQQGTAPQTPVESLDLEKQKLELEKQKLELEKQKLEFEKQKMEQGK